MKALYFSDIHTYPFNEFSQPTEDGRTTLILEHENTYHWVAEQIRDHKPDFVVNLGDTALTHGYLDAMSLNCIESGYTSVKLACEEVSASLFWMIGNHDLMNDSVRIHTLPFIREVVANVAVHGDLLFVPFYRDLQQAWDAISLMETKSFYRVFMHMDVIGARFNTSGLMSKDGMDPAQWEMLLKPDAKIFNGHYHHPQQINRRFYCLGSCMYRNFSDEVVDIPRGIVLDLGDDGQRHIENPCTSIYTTIRQTEPDFEEFRRKLEIPNPERTYVRIIYHPELHDVVGQYYSNYRGVKTIPLAKKKVTTVSMPSAFDPHKVVDAYIANNPPCISDTPPHSLLDEVRAKGHELVGSVLANSVKTSTHQVTFSSMHIENFMSIAAMDVRFDVDGVVYVDGYVEGREADVSNGAGKSSLFEAFFWCLFGELIRGGTADSVVNSVARKNCLVSLYCSVDDFEYQFMRTRKHKEFGNDLRIYREGILISQGTTSASNVLTTVLGANDDVFRHTTLLVDSLSTRFSLLNGRQRMELLESVIQAHLYDLLYNKIHELTKDANNRTLGIRTSLDRDRRVVEELREALRDLEVSREATKANLEATIAQKQLDLQKYQLEVATTESSLPAREEALAQVRDEIRVFEEVRTQKAKDQRDHEKYVRTLNSDIAIQKKVLADKRALALGSCPTCLRPYSSDVLAAEIQRIEADLAASEARLGQWDVYMEQVRQSGATDQAWLTEKRGIQQVLDGKIQNLRHQLSQQKSMVASLQSDISMIDKTLEASVSQIAAARDRIQKVEEEASSLESELAAREREWTILNYWDEGFSPKGGCRVWLLADAVNQLNDIATDYATMISDGHVLPILQISNQSIALEVTSQGGEYKISSSGERRMVDLSLQLALAKLSAKYSGFTCNVMILDEVEDKLDASARRRLLTVLNKLAADEGRTVFIASHYKDIKSYVDRVLTIVKRDGISVLTSAA